MTEPVNPTPDPQPKPPAEPAAAPAHRPIRVASILGSLAAACLCAAWFFPWVDVDAALARDFRATVERSIAERALTDRDNPSAGAEDFRQIAETMEEVGGLKGTDFIQWMRAGEQLSKELDAGVNPGVDADAHLRRLRLVQYLLYGIPLAAFLLLAHFLMHRFRRARAPVLILSNLTGGAAVVTAALLDVSLSFIGDTLSAGEAQLGLGWMMLLGGGAGLMLAGIFGVRGRNWYRVYLISAATAAALGVLAKRYLESGGLW